MSFRVKNVQHANSETHKIKMISGTTFHFWLLCKKTNLDSCTKISLSVVLFFYFTSSNEMLMSVKQYERKCKCTLCEGFMLLNFLFFHRFSHIKKLKLVIIYVVHKFHMIFSFHFSYCRFFFRCLACDIHIRLVIKGWVERMTGKQQKIMPMSNLVKSLP